jgi:putative FmdB family regulatory protein
MPTYDYECEKCQFKTEIYHSIKKRLRKKCPKCKSKMIRLVGRGGALIFNGPGFYQNDYADKK